ncbi:hypothetical protein H4R99_003971 [Coemansia sp. RSA 1722]|nr:hypothetical protein IWW45_003799 [Coemansia sp. RSA 485]KAJ2598358.1 hypothetical protein GGF39_002687 [Coemansia sp. RSA 1721]KAJ2598777.1 hypothetical protein H4R99_003971 [Coemansia sp. RSA 1722]KAJ2640310.1 hypothetical protein GGF40_000209 [Coemansia sp. RSA 1286]
MTPKPEQQTLAEQLEALGSTLKSQIMTDLNSWEEKKRAEQQQQQQQHGGRNKKYPNKRARPQPLPEIPHETLIDLRRVRHTLYTRGDEVVQEISSWAIGVLSVFVSVADMKGNCKLADLIMLPGTKAVFQLLLLAIESDFPRIGVDDAEMKLIHTVSSATKDPRAAGWILNQYGLLHRASFTRCLHLYCISQIPRISTLHGAGTGSMATAAAAAAADTPGLTQAISDLSSTFADENAQALNDILLTYRRVVDMHKTEAQVVAEIPGDDPRRFVLFYLLQLPLGRRLLFLDGSETAMAGSAEAKSEWLGDAIKFEMQQRFSLFVVPSEESVESLRPLKDAIGVLFGDTTKTKKISDQALDIQRSLGVFFLISSVTRGYKDAARQKDAADAEDDDDVEMQSVSAQDDRDWCTAFIDGCRDTLRQLVSREQELVILSQLPKMVKNMPQPIPNGLQETVQRGGRIYNNGSITMPAAGQSEGEAVCRALFRLIAQTGEASLVGDEYMPAARLFRTICEMAPLLVETLAIRFDSPTAVKPLFRALLEGWPIRIRDSTGTMTISDTSVYALHRTLAAVGEVGRGGAASRQLQQVCEALVGSAGDKRPTVAKLQHLVDVMATAASHRLAARDNVELMQRLTCIRDVVDGLGEALQAVWRSLWKLVFGTRVDIGDGWAMQTTLVYALKSHVCLAGSALSMRDRLALAESSLRELTVIQDVLLAAGNAATKRVGRCGDGVDTLLVLARELVSLVLALAKTPGVQQTVVERLVRILLLPESATSDPAELELLFSVGRPEPLREAKVGAPTIYESCLSSGRSRTAGVGLTIDAQDELCKLLEGKLVSAFSNGTTGSSASRRNNNDQLAHMAEQMLWQNAVRPLPKYPRSGMHRHSRTDDAWTFVRPSNGKSKHDRHEGLMLSSDSSSRHAVRRPLLVYTLLAAVRATTSGMAVLGTVLKEYYVDSMPRLPPAMLDQRLSGGRLQMRSAEMELLQDVRENADLEHIVFHMMQSDDGGEPAKILISALLVGLIVLWSGALSEPSRKRLGDLEFTVRLVDRVTAMAGDAGMGALSSVFPFVGGSDVARLLHVCVWRWVVHRMPGAEDESRRLVGHVLRRHLVDCAPLFRLFAI